MSEENAAMRLSKVIDGAPVAVTDEATDLLPLVRRLEQLNSVLPPVPPVLERRVARAVGSVSRGRSVAPQTMVRRASWTRPLFAGAVIALLALASFIVAGQGAMARFGGAITLGRVQVQILPPTVELVEQQVATSERVVASLAEAEQMVGRGLAAPEHLPVGYTLQRTTVAHYEASPGWWSPALFVDQTYHRVSEGSASELVLRQYFVRLGPGYDLTGLRFADGEVRQVRQVEVGDRPGVLVTVAGTGTPTGASVWPLYVLIWQGDDTAFELTAHDLTPDQMLAIARSVR